MQDGAILQLRIHPPLSHNPDPLCIEVPSDEELEDERSEAMTSMPQTPTDETEADYIPIAVQIRSDEPIIPFDCEADDDGHISPPPEYQEKQLERGPLLPRGPLTWIAAALLPMYTEKLTVTPDLNSAEKVVGSFTFYHDLRMATHESHYEKVFERMQTEWAYIGGLLVAVSAVNAGIFAISGDSLFKISENAKGAVAASSIAAGLGLVCDVWFLLRYSWATVETFTVSEFS